MIAFDGIVYQVDIVIKHINWFLILKSIQKINENKCEVKKEITIQIA